VLLDGLEGGVLDESTAADILTNLSVHLSPADIFFLEAANFNLEVGGRKCLEMVKFCLHGAGLVRLRVPSFLSDQQPGDAFLSDIDGARALSALKQAIEDAKPPPSSITEQRSVLILGNFMSRRRTRQRMWARIMRKNKNLLDRRLRRESDGAMVSVPPLEAPYRFHIFLSHVWNQGQDVMRILKLRLCELIPGLSVFLDVDDLEEGNGANALDSSSLVVIFATTLYFDSISCMRELLRAAYLRRPCIVLLESDPHRGGLGMEDVRERLKMGYESILKEGTILRAEMDQWGFSTSPSELYEFIFKYSPLVWGRLGPYQDMTLRLIAEEVLSLQKPTYVLGELATQYPTLPPPRRGEYHLFCSASNLDAGKLLDELVSELHLDEFRWSSEIKDLPACAFMLIYLTAQTWTSGEASTKFAIEVERALELGTHVILAYEAPPQVWGRPNTISFEDLRDVTPNSLLQAGIYQKIATPLWGGTYRRCSLVMLASRLFKAMSLREDQMGEAQWDDEREKLDDAPRPSTDGLSLAPISREDSGSVEELRSLQVDDHAVSAVHTLNAHLQHRQELAEDAPDWMLSMDFRATRQAKGKEHSRGAMWTRLRG